MTAEEAKKTAIEFRRKGIDELHNLIEKEAAKGKFSLILNETSKMNDQLKEILESEKYKVTYHEVSNYDRFSSPYYTINWELK